MIYSGKGFRDWEIGDIEVIIHERIYHLFHLIIPNHDYIAHAVSDDGINWRRVKNALFVGDPGRWDDDMIWTMDVSHDGDKFIMFYTGLALKDEGKIQRVGFAYSDDLYTWTKEDDESFLLESKGPHYEDLQNNPRTWLSFRDPYRYVEDNDDFLLICARVSEGAIHHRGCVALAKKEGDKYMLHKPLLHPGMYDDVECPCLIKINNYYYLIGSIREDVKVRYWVSDNFEGPYRSFHSDMLMPGGNYAARFVTDNGLKLLYGFYFLNKDLNYKRVLPPPKEIDIDDNGRLFMKSFRGWGKKVVKEIPQNLFPKPIRRLVNQTAESEISDNKWTFSSISGYQIFSFPKPSENIQWEGKITLEGLGKCGFVLNENGEGDAYYISIDFVNGYVRIRTWGFNEADMSEDFVFKKLQSNLFKVNEQRSHNFCLIYYGNYIELSIDGAVKLTLVDESLKYNNIGFYVASAKIAVENSTLKVLEDIKSSYTDILMH
jgi:beta-fructofuranosidase